MNLDVERNAGIFCSPTVNYMMRTVILCVLNTICVLILLCYMFMSDDYQLWVSISER